MADHPLRPATRRCLGGPLPRQLADRPRDPPEPESLSSADHAIRRRHSVLARVSACYPKVRGRFLTCFSPVRHSIFPWIAPRWISFDLHVLGTPPAFVLSQDQTLRREHVRRSLDAPEGAARGRDGTASNVRRSASSPVARVDRRSSCRPDLHPIGFQFRLTDGRTTSCDDARPFRTGVQSSLPFSRSIRMGTPRRDAVAAR